jgi:F-type H+-transporting ATPase subunit epsilon
MKPFNLRVLSPDHPYYEGKCESLVITTTEGEYGVMADHSNTIIAVAPGTIKIKPLDDNCNPMEPMLAAVSYGVIKIENNQVLVLVNSIENPDEIDEARALRDVEAAREAMLHQQSEKDYIVAKARMARAMNRLKVKNSVK